MDVYGRRGLWEAQKEVNERYIEGKRRAKK
jgi:hypothetical protein